MKAVLEVLTCLDDPMRLNAAFDAIPTALAQLAASAEDATTFCISDREVLTALLAVQRLLCTTSTKAHLIATNVLSWFTSGCLGKPACFTNEIQGLLRECMRTVARYNLENADRDLKLLSLFTRATCTISWMTRKDAVDLLDSTCATLDCDDELIRFWTYRATLNEAKFHSKLILLEAHRLIRHIDRVLQSVLGALADPAQRRILLMGASPHIDSMTVMQVKFILLCPQRPSGSHLKAVLDLCSPVCTTIWCVFGSSCASKWRVYDVVFRVRSDLLKQRGTVTEGTIASCCKVWKLLVYVASALLREPTPNVGEEAPRVLEELGSTHQRKEMFMNLLAPKNGVGMN
jgi:hypothetical protein